MGAMAASGGVRLVFSILIGRSFGPNELGHANVGLSTAIFATLVSSPGLGQSVARQLAWGGSVTAGPRAARLLRGGAVVHHALCLVLSIAVAVLAGSDRAEGLMLGAVTLSYGGYTYYKAVLYGLDRVASYVRLEFFWDAVFLSCLAAVVLLQATAMVLAPMVVLYGGFAVLAALRLRSPRGAGRSGTVAVVRGLLPFAVAVAIGTASSTGFLQLSMVFASRAEPGHGAGLFAAALTLVTPAYLLPRALSTVMFPAMARASGREDRDAVRTQLKTGTQMLSSGLLPGFVVAGGLASVIVTTFYGGAYEAAARVLVLMAWATWVSIASVPSVNALSSARGRWFLLPTGAALSGLVVGLAWWLVAGSSIEGVAWGYLVGSVIQSAVPMVAAWRLHRISGGGALARAVAGAAFSLCVSMTFAHARGELLATVSLLNLAVVTLLVLPELRELARTLSRRPDVRAAQPSARAAQGGQGSLRQDLEVQED